MDAVPAAPHKAHGIFAAYHHLLLFRLGWSSPGLGLLRWYEEGRPNADPVLEFMNRLGGNGIDWFIAWAARYEHIGVPEELVERLPSPGGFDELHLSTHCSAPGLLGNGGDWPDRYRLTPGSLVCDDYVGWWSALALAPDAHFDQGLDVVVKQIGWLGCYSRSQLTGIPHATTEHIHSWGFGGKRKA